MVAIILGFLFLAAFALHINSRANTYKELWLRELEKEKDA